MSNQNEWESVDKYGETERLKVPGGWLYKYESKYGEGREPTMVFVPSSEPSGIKWGPI